MNRFHARTAIAFCALMVSLAVIAVVTAGPLNPPAGPAVSSYKTLSEVEPRTVVNAVNTPGNAGSTYVISVPGSYCLDRELVGQASKAGITITVPNVTLDLRGFTLNGVAGATAGIVLSAPAGAAQVEVRNGTLRGWSQAAIRGTGGDVARTSLVGLRIIHAGNSPAVHNLSAGWIRDCDIDASASAGGGGLVRHHTDRSVPGVRLGCRVHEFIAARQHVHRAGRGNRGDTDRRRGEHRRQAHQ